MEHEKDWFPPKYTLGVMKFDPNNPMDFVNQEPEKIVDFDIVREADYLTASCNELHLIVSGANWDELEPKINKVFQQKMIEEEEKW
jgi:hypothetical protein